MAQSFIGYPALCTLHDGSKVTGTVKSINAQNGTVTLENVSIENPTTGSIISIESKLFQRTEIAGIQLLKKASDTPKQTSASPASSSASAAAAGGQRRNKKTDNSAGGVRKEPLVPYFSDQNQPQHYPQHQHQQPLQPNRADSTTPPSSASKGKKKSSNGVRRKKKAAVAESIGGNDADLSEAAVDEDGYYNQHNLQSQPQLTAQQQQQRDQFSQDFDFGAGLKTFDKERVFQEIRDQDTIDPSLRLVAHNRKALAVDKLAIDETVLTSAELSEQSDARTNAIASRSLAYKASTSNLGPGLAPVAVGSVGTTKAEEKAKDNSKRTLKTQDGVKVFPIKLKQMKEILSIADIETGPSSLQRIETAALGLVSVAFSSTSSSSSKPFICVGCGDSEKGVVALRAGSHLSNRGAKVVAFVGSSEGAGTQSELYKTSLRMFSSAGGRIIRDVEDLKAGDLFIDALADNDKSTSTSGHGPSAVHWAMSNGVPILSIDVPFGVDHDTGHSHLSPATTPSVLVCLGALRPSVASSQAQIVLIDVGLSPLLWPKIGVDNWEKATFGKDSVVRVE